MAHRRFARLTGGAVLLVAAAIIPFFAKRSQTPAAAPPAPVAHVVVARPLAQRIVEWDEYTGRLEPIEFVEVRARVGGYLKDDSLRRRATRPARATCSAVIDRRPVRSPRSGEAEAAVRRGQRQARPRPSPCSVSASPIRSEARSSTRLEATALSIAPNARGPGAITREDFDIRESSLAQAQATGRIRRRRHRADARRRSTSPRAAVGTAEAGSTRPNIQLNYTQVKAPISGRVSKRVVTEGNLISGGTAESTLLTTIVSLDPIHVTFDADEAAFLKYQRLAGDG